jgi:hypothetical protein
MSTSLFFALLAFSVRAQTLTFSESDRFDCATSIATYDVPSNICTKFSATSSRYVLAQCAGTYATFGIFSDASCSNSSFVTVYAGNPGTCILRPGLTSSNLNYKVSGCSGSFPTQPTVNGEIYATSNCTGPKVSGASGTPGQCVAVPNLGKYGAFQCATLGGVNYWVAQIFKDSSCIALDDPSAPCAYGYAQSGANNCQLNAYAAGSSALVTGCLTSGVPSTVGFSLISLLLLHFTLALLV